MGKIKNHRNPFLPTTNQPTIGQQHNTQEMKRQTALLLVAEIFIIPILKKGVMKRKSDGGKREREEEHGEKRKKKGRERGKEEWEEGQEERRKRKGRGKRWIVVEDLDRKFSALLALVEHYPAPNLHKLIATKLLAYFRQAGVVMPDSNNYDIGAFRTHLAEIRAHLVSTGDPLEIAHTSALLSLKFRVLNKFGLRLEWPPNLTKEASENYGIGKFRTHFV
ncbi:hypothetical protein niasHT_000550 [Heterodera trifolii]|uniref:Uncharacterized protein n=1 Tax=Heterodera trifolii TaxID=157864 RepID=A0ABD2M4E3_9BILA